MRLMLPLIAAAAIASGTALAQMSTSSGKKSPTGNPDDNNALVAPPSDNTAGQGAWSDERMRNAKPKPLPNVNPGRERDQPK